MSEPAAGVVSRLEPRDVDRSTRAMTVVTALSRGSGFVRVVVFASVFGKTFLANTYQNANTIPNILFELFAAGALQAVLVPTMVRLVDAGDETESRHVAGAVLGLLSAALSVVVVAGIAVGPQIMRLLVHDVSDPATRAAETELGALFLWFFMPQILFYGANVVATAVLNAHHRFALPVFAPLVNNVVVIAAYVWFDRMHGDRPLTPVLSGSEKWVVAGGTTLGVVLFCGLPVLAVVRMKFPLRPNLDWRHPAIGSLVREGAWAALFLGLMQVLQLVVLRVANREPGGVTVWQWAFILFTLPHALFSVPVMTTRYPQLTRQAHSGDWTPFAATTSEAVRSIGFMAMLCSAVFVAASLPATQFVAFGGAREFAPEIAAATAWFAPGIVGFGLLLFFTRALYAVGDARTPTLVNLVIVVAASAVMLAAVPHLAGHRLLSGLAATFAASQLVGAAALGAVVAGRLRRSGGEVLLAVVASLARCVASAALAGWLGWLVADAWDAHGGMRSFASAACSATLAAVVFIGLQWALGGPDPGRALRTMGASTRRGATG